MISIARSLTDLLGDDYMAAVKRCAVALYGMEAETAEKLACERVEFFGQAAQLRQDELLASTGTQFMSAFSNANTGAPTAAFGKASNLDAAPLGGLGIFRMGEDGRLYIAAKSEHYHISLGHNFSGYRLLDNARRLGITNATHNNTRGYITRLMEREIIRTVNGISKGDDSAMASVLQSTKPKVLNRIINLETGSLAVEAGIKMMLGRFYRLDGSYTKPLYDGKTPVFLVMEDNDGGLEANYHGTTIVAQTFRGMWPELYREAEKAGLYKVVSVAKNDIADFEQKIQQYNQGQYKTAGFLHEIVLMNYGGIRLTEQYLQAAYRLCAKFDTPTMVDEIQSCMWYKGMLLFRLYGLNPDFVILGKGFPGGEYPASKVITTYEMDSLNLFGALVTNGQEELASLAYLITMEYAAANGDEIQRLGDYFEAQLNKIERLHPVLVKKIEGRGHLAAIHFDTVETAVSFTKIMNAHCIDVSAQTYKANCPPAALLKLPLITSEAAMDFIIEKIDDALRSLPKTAPREDK
jgi:acetylornithine/succinyldiaminopimelate/putrescine aminotransferase